MSCIVQFIKFLIFSDMHFIVVIIIILPVKFTIKWPALIFQVKSVFAGFFKFAFKFKKSLLCIKIVFFLLLLNLLILVQHHINLWVEHELLTHHV